MVTPAVTDVLSAVILPLYNISGVEREDLLHGKL